MRQNTDRRGEENVTAYTYGAGRSFYELLAALL